MDGVTLFAAGLIGGGVAIVVVVVVAVARRTGMLTDRRGVSAGRGRGAAPVRPRDARLRPDLDGARPMSVFREDLMARRGARPDRRDLRDPRELHDRYRAREPDPRRTAPRDEGGYASPRRPDANRRPQGMPPVRPSALVGDTVQLQSVPAWSMPARPLNGGPTVRPVGADHVPNEGPRYLATSTPPEPGANASRRHDDISKPEGRVYGGR